MLQHAVDPSSNEKKDFKLSAEKIVDKAETFEKPDTNSFSNMKQKFYYANKILALQRKIAEQVCTLLSHLRFNFNVFHKNLIL